MPISHSGAAKRRFLLKVYGGRYEKHYSSRPGCFYCGDKWTEVDHCPPLSWVEAKEPSWFWMRKIKFVLVNSCHECNISLSDQPLFTLQERATFIRHRLENKAEKFVFWSDDELKEMSPRFQRSIKARMELQNTLIDRIHFAQELQFRPEDFPP
jgi:hypothetical protein